MTAYNSIAGHRSMVFDEIRNSAYEEAIAAAVRPGDVILDLGAGLGIHGLIAASKGAKRVYLVDPSQVSIIANKIVKDNGLSEKIICINKPIEEADIPEKVDHIVSVFTGNFLLEEDLLPSLFYARDRYLKPGGTMIPETGEMRVVPVSSSEYYAQHVDVWNKPAFGISFRSVREYAVNTPIYDKAEARQADYLAQPTTLTVLDFPGANVAESRNEVSFKIEKGSICHGFVGWFRVKLGAHWLSTSPEKPALHWSQVFLPLKSPMHVKIEDTIKFTLSRPQYGEWTWTITLNDSVQRLSSFLSRPVTPAQLKYQTADYKPGLSSNGALVQFVTALMNKEHSNQSILELAREKFADTIPLPGLLEKRVRDIIKNYGE